MSVAYCGDAIVVVELLDYLVGNFRVKCMCMNVVIHDDAFGDPAGGLKSFLKKGLRIPKIFSRDAPLFWIFEK